MMHNGEGRKEGKAGRDKKKAERKCVCGKERESERARGCKGKRKGENASKRERQGKEERARVYIPEKCECMLALAVGGSVGCIPLPPSSPPPPLSLPLDTVAGCWT